MAFGDDVEQRGWQTGSVVPAAMLDAITEHLTRPGQPPTPIDEADWLVVISQTCDIVAPRLDAEPLIEVLHCRPLPGKPRKGRRDLESTRYLDFRPNRATHPKLVLAAHALADRFVIPRDLLPGFAPEPDRRLDAIAAQRILAWYALRAARPSWPGTFCDRVRSVRSALEDALDQLADDIAEVRVAIVERDQELPADESYNVAVYFVVDEQTWESDPEGRKLIHEAFGKFVFELAACAGILVNEELSEVVPGNEFSWQEVKQTDLWDFANLSHRD